MPVFATFQIQVCPYFHTAGRLLTTTTPFDEKGNSFAKTYYDPDGNPTETKFRCVPTVKTHFFRLLDFTYYICYNMLNSFCKI